MVKMIIAIKRRQGMTHDQFVQYQREVHRPKLMAIPEASLIRRFVCSYPVAAAAYNHPGQTEPDYDCIVEAQFDSMEDLDRLYQSENFRSFVDPDHQNFMDMDGYGRIIAEEEVVIG